MRRWLLIVICGCGRLGFEPPELVSGDPDAQASDGIVMSDATSVIQDMCPTTIPSLASVATIDGALEPGLTLSNQRTPVWEPQIPGLVLPATYAASWVVAWRPDGLYFFVDATDPDRWPAENSDDPYCGDGIELYVDSDGTFDAAPLYDASGTRQLIARAPTTDTTSVSSGDQFANASPAGNWVNGYIAAPRIGGYTFEAFVNANTLGLGTWTLSAGQAIGFDFSVNVSSTDGVASPGQLGAYCPNMHRIGQTFFQIDETTTTAPPENVSAFCIATLQ